MKEFILILREDFDQMNEMSPEEMQDLIKAHMDWVKELTESGHFKAGDGLDKTGSVITGSKKVVTDGPYLEAREGVGGYYILMSENLENAIEIAKNCPTLGHEGSVEIRPILIY